MRGLGFASRQDFELPAEWKQKRRQIRGREKWSCRLERIMNLCLTQSSKASQSKGEHSVDYEPGRWKTEISSRGKQEIVCESSQVTKLIEDINETLCCAILWGSPIGLAGCRILNILGAIFRMQIKNKSRKRELALSTSRNLCFWGGGDARITRACVRKWDYNLLHNFINWPCRLHVAWVQALDQVSM